MEAVLNFLQQTGFYTIAQNPMNLIMVVVACFLLYLAIVKQFEPLLLLPIAFGMLLVNLDKNSFFYQNAFFY